MNEALIQKLLLSIAGLTALYVIYINVFHQDMTRRISRSIVQFIPGILLLVVGIVLSKIFKNPGLTFKHIVTFKSGTARSIIGSTLLPLVAESIYTVGIITGFTAIIDKLLYYWKGRQLPYLFTLVITIFSAIIATTTLLVVISGKKELSMYRTEQLNTISILAFNILGITALLLVILNIAKALKKS